MLGSLDEQVRNCLRHAEHCAARAATASAADEQRDFLMLERRWLSLAHSLEYSRDVERFTADAQRRQA